MALVTAVSPDGQTAVMTVHRLAALADKGWTRADGRPITPVAALAPAAAGPQAAGMPDENAMRHVWADYAEQLGVEVHTGMNRNAIRDAVETHLAGQSTPAGDQPEKES